MAETYVVDEGKLTAVVMAPPLNMHARKPSRFEYAYAIVNEIQAGEPLMRSPLWEAVEQLGRIASDVGSHERNTALHGLRRVRELQTRG